jgi:hypothetical protein
MLVTSTSFTDTTDSFVTCNHISDLHHYPGTKNTFFTPQLNVSAYLKEKAAAGQIEYTSVSCGFFFDWSKPFIHLYPSYSPFRPRSEAHW